ncbi:hypothetical protein YC2023_064258 [Brassica napus]
MHLYSMFYKGVLKRCNLAEDVADAYKAIELELTLAIAYFSNGYDFFINSLYQGEVGLLKGSSMSEISELKKQTKISYERQLNRITEMVISVIKLTSLLISALPEGAMASLTLCGVP